RPTSSWREEQGQRPIRQRAGTLRYMGPPRPGPLRNRPLGDKCSQRPSTSSLHQALGGEADHLAQQVGVGALFQKGTKVHHLVGHRWILGSVAWFSDQTLPMIRDGHRKPLARYRATYWRARSLLASARCTPKSLLSS